MELLETWCVLLRNRVEIKMEGIKSVMQINVNGSNIMLNRIFQVLLLLHFYT